MTGLQACGNPQFTKVDGSLGGWSHQELLAPASVKFYSVEWGFLGDKRSLVGDIQDITKIHIRALRGESLAQFSVLQRIAWSSSRQTTKEEDTAYCLLGIFEVFIPLIYGEGKTHAMERLLEAVDKRKDTSDSQLGRGKYASYLSVMNHAV
jgi:hypothetical protein